MVGYTRGAMRTSDVAENGRTSATRVDVIIGVHNTSRPVERAVASALRNRVAVRVMVVAHNTDPNAVRRRLGALANDPRVVVLDLHDGIRSPANSYNHALDSAIADFVSVVGSDDELAPGALDAWVGLADRVHAEVVMAPILRVGGGPVPSPRVRPGRTDKLDGDRDRLFERTAPLGLVGRARFGGLRFTEGLPRGIDQAYGLHLWFSGARIAFDPTTPPYLEHDDQRDRVTKVGGPAIDDLRYFDAIEADPVFQTIPSGARRAVAAKIVRVHVISSIATHLGESGLTEEDRRDLAHVVDRLRGWAPRLDQLLSRRDHRALATGLRPGASGDEIRAAIGDRRSYLSPAALVPRNPLLTLHRHAPFRSLVAARFVARAIDRSAARSTTPRS